MVLQVTPKKILPIGLDLGSSAAKLVQLRGGQGGVELFAYGVVNIPRHLRKDQAKRLDFISQNIPRILKSRHFKGRKCILALPAENSFVRHVKVPRLDPKAMELAVHRAIQAELPYPLGEAVIRHIAVGEVFQNAEARQEVIVVAIPLATMDSYLHMAGRAGLEVVGVNVEPLAIIECFSNLKESQADDERAVLYVDLGAESTQVVISRQCRIVFARNLPRGAGQLEQTIAGGLNIPQEQVWPIRRNLQMGRECDFSEERLDRYIGPWVEQMSGQIDQCLKYYEYVFRVPGVREVIFTGGQAEDKRLCGAMAERLNLTGRVGKPVSAVQLDRDSASADPAEQTSQAALAVGIGLSLSGKDFS